MRIGFDKGVWEGVESDLYFLRMFPEIRLNAQRL